MNMLEVMTKMNANEFNVLHQIKVEVSQLKARLQNMKMTAK